VNFFFLSCSSCKGSWEISLPGRIATCR
jgi:hypothetical protein